MLSWLPLAPDAAAGIAVYEYPVAVVLTGVGPGAAAYPVPAVPLGNVVVGPVPASDIVPTLLHELPLAVPPHPIGAPPAPVGLYPPLVLKMPSVITIVHPDPPV